MKKYEDVMRIKIADIRRDKGERGISNSSVVHVDITNEKFTYPRCLAHVDEDTGF